MGLPSQAGRSLRLKVCVPVAFAVVGVGVGVGVAVGAAGLFALCINPVLVGCTRPPVLVAVPCGAANCDTIRPKSTPWPVPAALGLETAALAGRDTAVLAVVVAGVGAVAAAGCPYLAMYSRHTVAALLMEYILARSVCQLLDLWCG